MEGVVYGFGRFRLFVRERLLLKDDVTLSLGSRAFDVLVALVERAGETVNRQELFELVWPDVVVSKVNLRVHVAGLRKALGDRRDGNRFIVSVAGRGYRFVAPVSRLQSAVPAAALTRSALEPLRSARVFARVGTISTLRLATDLDGAVCFVDFANIDDPAGVAMAVASALESAAEVLRLAAFTRSPQHSNAS